MNHDTHEPNHPARTFWRSRYGIGLLIFAAIALFFLLTEHRAHTLGALPYLLLAASPLLHIFMHRGHGHVSADDGNGPSVDHTGDTQMPDGDPTSTHRHH
ncbi:MAG: DUF2933 domain-containing protein [Burkholderiales bacterium]|nr:DUF2933 domain-containing protein [Burkholderiales bacterium]